MKKKWLATIGLSPILTVAVCLVGCSSSGSTGTTSNAAATVAYTHAAYLNSGLEQIVGYSAAPGNGSAVVSSFTQTPPKYLTGPIATDQTGQVYSSLLSASSNSIEIDVYPPYPTGVTGPSRSIQIQMPPESVVFGLAVDSAGLLYVAYNTWPYPVVPTVAVYSAAASGAATPIRTMQPSAAQPEIEATDMALDADGNIYIAGYATISETTKAYVWVYPPTASGLSMPSRTINAGGNGLAASGVAVAPAGDVFVNVWGGVVHYIEEFAPGAEGAATPVNTMYTSVETPGYSMVYCGPVRLDGAGNIFTSFEVFADPDNLGAPAPSAWFIYGYEPTATGSQAPSVQIAPLTRYPLGDGAYFALH
ncbi:MAG TPA: hypothetical protein VKF84_02795 [Candidatus Sulfotelmatobacter sp.]|nr:hypothetical protein [Candidatus Sulfotelmatobacter sp.]